jgi:hypothetical protein
VRGPPEGGEFLEAAWHAGPEGVDDVGQQGLVGTADDAAGAVTGEVARVGPSTFRSSTHRVGASHGLVPAMVVRKTVPAYSQGNNSAPAG